MSYSECLFIIVLYIAICTFYEQIKMMMTIVLSRVYTRTHVTRQQVVSTCCRQHVSCIGNKIVASFVASLLPVCCWKWIVIMSPRYSQHLSRTSNLYPATCVHQHICIRIQVARSGHMLPAKAAFTPVSQRHNYYSFMSRSTCIPLYPVA